MKWNSSYYSPKVFVCTQIDWQTNAEVPSRFQFPSLFSAPHPTLLPNCWFCCLTEAPHPPPGAYLQTHWGCSYIRSTAPHAPATNFPFVFSFQGLDDLDASDLPCMFCLIHLYQCLRKTDKHFIFWSATFFLPLVPQLLLQWWNV